MFTPGVDFSIVKVEQVHRSPTFFAAFCSAKVGRRRTATFDRAISMNVAEQKSYEKSTSAYAFCIFVKI